ncbi:DUF4139 domain-containing protein [Alkalilimnicola ehrlichii MLHE-1]|uniref:DUF4139 domain-containing protein n=1 Tax=Alkalilimnicola ehrlichii (strain ATCC BAA-1101 / DSM 17681 / MLHE-1) TaxID=187272 RepID=Q0A5G4_ALKEH|nr:DUF4139 domain-containing protein [Alkalilimnicola ehrlichii]ABI57923.1 conserved hypothetical protein [Alkalilimnicola ehrlichii MLHE-1]
MNAWSSTLLATLLATGPALTAAAPPAQESGADDREALSITVYQRDLALVREQRRLELPEDGARVQFTGLPGALDPGSLHLRSETPLRASGLDWTTGELDIDRLLTARRGHTLTLVHDASGRRITGRLLHSDDRRVLLETDHGAETVPLNDAWRIRFGSLPAHLQPLPALTLDLTPDEGGEQPVELAYLTGGLSWSARHTATLDETGEALRLESLAAIDNRSGGDWPQARLQLLAGDTHGDDRPVQPMALRSQAAEAAAPEREALAGYHLYTLPDPLTLRDGETRLATLAASRTVPVERQWVSRGQAGRQLAERQPQGVTGRLVFDNGDPTSGTPMPAGPVQVYGPDRHGELQYLGEQRIGHTPAGQTVRLDIGRSFDVTAERTPVSWRRLDERGGFEAEWHLRVDNAGEQAVTVQLEEELNGDWQILEESEAHERVSARLARWALQVPAEGRTELRYRVEVRR